MQNETNQGHEKGLLFLKGKRKEPILSLEPGTDFE